MTDEKHTPGPWIAKSYDPDKDGRLHWGVRQSPDAPSVSVDGEVLYCGLSICVIVEQDMEDVEHGEECANAHLIAVAPKLLEACREFVRKVECGEARSKRSYAQMKSALADYGELKK